MIRAILFSLLYCSTSFAGEARFTVLGPSSVAATNSESNTAVPGVTNNLGDRIRMGADVRYSSMDIKDIEANLENQQAKVFGMIPVGSINGPYLSGIFVSGMQNTDKITSGFSEDYGFSTKDTNLELGAIAALGNAQIGIAAKSIQREISMEDKFTSSREEFFNSEGEVSHTIATLGLAAKITSRNRIAITYQPKSTKKYTQTESVRVYQDGVLLTQASTDVDYPEIDVEAERVQIGFESKASDDSMSVLVGAQREVAYSETIDDISAESGGTTTISVASEIMASPGFTPRFGVERWENNENSLLRGHLGLGFAVGTMAIDTAVSYQTGKLYIADSIRLDSAGWTGSVGIETRL